MGVNITDLLQPVEVDVRDLANKVIVIDAPLFLYQFLTSIRQRDGTLLSDSRGNITSHLVGVLSRTTNLIEKGVKPVYVFDGKSPELKKKERDRRKELKKHAQKLYERAKQDEDTDSMRKYASRTTRLTKDLIEEAKELISALGVPVIHAPAEAEAQAAHIVKKGEAYAVASQDGDALLFGANRLIRNLSMIGKRKKVNKLSYVTIRPERIDLSDTLNQLGIDNDQLIVLGMLIGTDFNVGGIKGIGPKKALKLLKQYKNDFDSLFLDMKWDEQYDIPWTEVFYTIKRMPVTDNYTLEWKEVDTERVYSLLVQKREFSEERVAKTLAKVVKKPKEQKGLGDFF